MINNYKTVLLFLIFNLNWLDTYGLISPIKRNPNNKPLLTNCEDIRLVSQQIELYHHPLGIWKIYCTCEFQNLYPKKVLQEMAFNSGYDIGMNEGELYCDEFNNFRVFVDGEELKSINMKEQCLNYVDRIGIDWTNDDKTGIGFLNTWQVKFKPEETKQIKVSFNFIVKKPSLSYQPNLKEPWYIELMTWMKSEYNKRAENDFKLPLNMGSFWAMFVDSLTIKTYHSNEWLKFDDLSKIVYKPENIVIYTYSEPFGFFSPPAVELHPLTEEDLKDKTTTELNLLRNSFFAKYGRKFTVTLLQLYFQNQPWYYENPDYDNWYLTDLDIQNIKFIYQYVNKKANK